MTRCVKISHKIIAQGARQASLDEYVQIVKPFALEQEPQQRDAFDETLAKIRAHYCPDCDE